MTVRKSTHLRPTARAAVLVPTSGAMVSVRVDVSTPTTKPSAGCPSSNQLAPDLNITRLAWAAHGDGSVGVREQSIRRRDDFR